MNENSKFGVINEIGDLGLGFMELNDKDQEVLRESENKNDKKENNKNKNIQK